ncbi:MAG: hypothetical protein RL033_6772 [Pseudomonadota bacterium]
MSCRRILGRIEPGRAEGAQAPLEQRFVRHEALQRTSALFAVRHSQLTGQRRAVV